MRNHIQIMNIIFKVSIFLIVTLVILQIWVSHAMITQGANLKKIEDLERQLTQENLMLKNDIATHSAFLNIASASATLGFYLPKAVQYIR